MLQGLTGWHLLIILAVILLLFGAAKLPALAKSMGQSARVFKGEMKAMKDEDRRSRDARRRRHHGSRGRSAGRSTPAPTQAVPPTPSPEHCGHGGTAAHRRSERAAA